MSIAKSLNNAFKLNQNLITILLLCIIIMGAALRFHDLGAESYWSDELIMIEVAQENLETYWSDQSTQENLETRLNKGWVRPPLFVFLAHFWMQVFGTSETATRSLSAITSIMAIPVMYMVGRELLGKRAGLISALLIAVGGIQILQAQNFRYYGLYVFLTLLSYLFYIRALKSRNRTDFVLYTAATILLYYTHTTAVFVLMAQGLYFLLQWKKYEEVKGWWIMSQALILLGLAPSLLQVGTDFLEVVGGKIEYDGVFHPMTHLPDPPLWLPLYTLGKYVSLRPSWEAILGGVVFFLSGILFFGIRQGKVRWFASLRELKTILPDYSSRRRTELLLIGLWLLCPVLTLFILSKVIGPMYHYNYTMSASPAFYLLMALGITAVRKVLPEFISIGFLMILIASGLQNYYVDDIRPQWRQVAAYVTENANSGDVLMFGAKEEVARTIHRRGFYWYYQGFDLPECGVEDTQFENNEAIMATLVKCTSNSERIWLITRGPNRIGHLKPIFFNPELEAIRLIGEQHFTGRSERSVYLFSLDQDAMLALWTRTKADLTDKE